MASIRQNPSLNALPDFRNLGVMARVLVLVNVFALALAMAAEPDWNRMLEAFLLYTAMVEPPLLASLVVLYFGARFLRGLPYAAGCGAVLALALALAAVTHAAVGAFAGTSLARTLAFATVSAVLALAYLTLHWRAY